MNKLTILFLTHLTLLGLISCTPDVAEIKTVNFDSLRPDPSQGITVKQSQDFLELRQKLQKENTIDKRLIKTTITNEKGKRLSLTKVISTKSLLLIGSPNCPYSKICFLENFPKIIDSLKQLNINTKLIKLIVHESDSINFNKLNNKLEEYLNVCKSIYPENTYLISRNEVKKLNFYSNVATYFIDENQIIRDIRRGASLERPYKKLDKVKQFFSDQ